MPEADTTHQYEGIDIVGSNAFIATTRNALEVLKTTRCFETIRSNLQVIEEGSRSGVYPHVEGAKFIVGYRTWTSHLIWYASGIAHEAYHNVIYRSPKTWRWIRPAFWNRKQDERECLEFQLGVLGELNAPNVMVEYVLKLMVNPNYIPRWWNLFNYLREPW
jgi:hypothetical protein